MTVSKLQSKIQSDTFVGRGSSELSLWTESVLAHLKVSEFYVPNFVRSLDSEIAIETEWLAFACN